MTPLPLAEVDYVESSLVQIVKAIVIFAFVLQIVPLILLLERKLLGRFQARYRPEPRRPLRRCSSRSPTC